MCFCFFFQAEDGIRDIGVTGVQTCALPIFSRRRSTSRLARRVEWDASRRALELICRMFMDSLHQVGWVTELNIFVAGMIRKRSEERRVGKEWRSGWSPWQEEETKVRGRA